MIAKKRFDPCAMTTERIMRGDDTVQAVKLQGQTKTFRRSLTLKPILGHDGGARLAGGQTIRSRSR
jgi:hypothetical protein